jgi:hypothetical protein
MDPYLEEPGLWPDVHHELISEVRAVLTGLLRPKYYLRVEERVYISDENDPGRKVIIPDVRIADNPNWQGGQLAAMEGGGLAVAEPIEVTSLIDDEIHEAQLEIIDRAQRQVVTVIEIASPTNKVAGSQGRASYLRKRQEAMNSPSHLVEIDLLRAGDPLNFRELLPPHDYLVHVSIRQRRPRSRASNASATRSTSVHTSAKPFGTSDTSRGHADSHEQTARSTSRKLTAHTSHCDCVTITSGSSSRSRSASTR